MAEDRQQIDYGCYFRKYRERRTFDRRKGDSFVVPNLRDRIATVIQKHWNAYHATCWDKIADAIIKELGL